MKYEHTITITFNSDKENPDCGGEKALDILESAVKSVYSDAEDLDVDEVSDE